MFCESNEHCEYMGGPCLECREDEAFGGKTTCKFSGISIVILFGFLGWAPYALKTQNEKLGILLDLFVGFIMSNL